MPHKESPGGGPGLSGDLKSNCTQHKNFSLPASRFKDLFLAFNGAHGRVRVGDIDPVTQKRQSKPRTVHEGHSLGHFENHLAGEGDSLGLAPLLDDGHSVKWGAIDIDEYGGEFPFATLCEQIATLKLPLVVARTKSGGAHCYLLLSEPTPATLVQSVLRNWAARLGYPGTEVYPKQIGRKSGDIGNWLNMPYYGDERWAFDAAGQRLTLPEFLDFAESRLADALALVPFADVEEIVPTSKQLAGRNDWLFDRGSSLRGQGYSIADIEQDLRERNAAADPDDHPNFAAGPVDEAELRGIIQRVGRYERGVKKVRPGIPPRWSSEEMSPMDARAKLDATVAAWVEETHRRRQEEIDTPFHSLILAGAGTGKSHTVLRHLPSDNGTTFYYVPTVEIGEELATKAREDFGLDCLVVRGRIHEQRGKTLCARPEVIKEARAHNIRNISQACCYKEGEGDEDFACSHFNACEYQAQFEMIPDVVFLAHQYLFQPMGGKLGKPDRIIIDEDLVRTLVATPKGFSPSELDGPYGEMIVNALVAGESPKLALKEAGVTRKSLNEAATEIDKEAVVTIHPAMSDKEMKAALKNIGKVGPAPMVYRRIAEEFNLERTETYSMNYAPKVKVKVIDENGEVSREFHPRIFVQYRRKPRLQKGVPVLLLDATANPELLKSTFPDLETTVINPKRNAHVIQVTHQVAGKGAMQQERNQKDVGAFLMAVEAIHGAGAVISHKDAMEVLPVPEKWVGGWFNNIRGSNEYENCPVGVIVGRVEPTGQSIERLTRGLFYDKPVSLALGLQYVKVERGYRMRSGEYWGTDVSEHPDPLCQSMLETKREAEVLQAIDRLRLVNDGECKTIYLLTSVPVDVTVDKLVPWNSVVGMRDRLEVAVRKLGGVIPLKAAWLADRLPELWESPKAAERSIDRLPEMTHKPPLYYNNIYSEPGVCGLRTLSDAKAYEFRLKGQARPTRVLSHLSVEDTRQWLEKEFGPGHSLLPPLAFEFIPAKEPGGKPSAWFAAEALLKAFQMLTGGNPSKPCCGVSQTN